MYIKKLNVGKEKEIEQIRRGGQRRKKSGGRPCFSVRISTSADWNKFTTTTTAATTTVVLLKKVSGSVCDWSVSESG